MSERDDALLEMDEAIAVYAVAVEALRVAEADRDESQRRAENAAREQWRLGELLRAARKRYENAVVVVDVIGYVAGQER